MSSPPPLSADYRRLRRGTSGTFLVFAASAGLGFLGNVIIARLLGPAEYGDYALTVTWVNVLAVVALLGQDTGVVRFLPAYIYSGDWGRARGLRRASSFFVLIAGIILGLAGALIAYLMRLSLGNVLETSLLIGFFMLPLFAELQLSGTLHRGLKRAVSAYGFSGALRQIFLVLIVAGLWLAFTRRFDAPFSLFAYAIAVVFALLFSVAFLNRAWPQMAKIAQPVYEFAIWRKVGLQLFMLGVIGVVLNRIDVLLLGGISGNQAVGPYFAAVQLANFGLYGLSAVNTLLAPLIAEYYSAQRHADLATLLHHAAWLTFVITFIVAVALAVFGFWILRLFGHGFTAAYVPMLVLLLGQCVNAASGPTGYLLSMTKFESQALLIYGGGAILNVLLSFALIPHLGMFGAAIASAGAMATWNVAALAFICRYLNVNPTIFTFTKL